MVCGDWHLADDLVQEPHQDVRVVARLQRIGADSLAYARRVVVNAAIDRGRRRSSRELATAEIRDASGSEPDRDTRIVLRRALLRVPARRRACLVLRFLEDMSVAGAAEALDCSEGTVKSQVSRGLDDLRAALSAEGLSEHLLEEVTL